MSVCKGRMNDRRKVVVAWETMIKLYLNILFFCTATLAESALSGWLVSTWWQYYCLRCQQVPGKVNIVCVIAKAANSVWPLTSWKATDLQSHKNFNKLWCNCTAATQNERIIVCMCMSCVCHAPEGSSSVHTVTQATQQEPKMKADPSFNGAHILV